MANLQLMKRRNDERVTERVLLEPHHFRESQAGEQLNVEDLLHGGLELQHSADAAGGEVHHRYAALQVVASRRQGDAVHR